MLTTKKITTDKDRLKRALGYALTLVSFQEVGSGPDENLELVRKIAYNILRLCKIETGYDLPNSYPIEFVKEHEKEVLELLPFTLIKLVEEKLYTKNGN